MNSILVQPAISAVLCLDIWLKANLPRQKTLFTNRVQGLERLCLTTEGPDEAGRLGAIPKVGQKAGLGSPLVARKQQRRRNRKDRRRPGETEDGEAPAR